MHYTCPICGEKLNRQGKSLICLNRHCYDISKEGYVNLHISNKKSELIGDNKQMILARRDFLKLGHYEKLAQAVSSLISKYATKESVILDCGCGTGYYTNIFSKNKDIDVKNLLAIDISKEGIKLAAKETKEVTFAIASAYKLPLENNSVDIIISIFAPYAIDEMKRVIKDDGKVIFVNPNKLHLWELKQAIYGDKTHEKDFTVDFSSLRKVEEFNLNYTFTLKNKDEVNNLLTMTPYIYKTPKELLENANNVIGKTIQADFNISVLEK